MDQFSTASIQESDRRFGDTVSIPGGYQYHALMKGYSVQRFWHKAKYETALEGLDPIAGDVILDAGCGSGVLADWCAAVPGTQVIGLDTSDAALSFCRTSYGRSNLSFHKGLVDELSFEDNLLTKISLLEVLEHVTEEQGRATLKEFHRVLQPGGQVVLTTPNYRSLWPMIEWTMDRFGLVPKLAEEQHVSRYNRKSLTRLAEQTGFTVREGRTILFLAPWLAFLGERVSRTVHKVEQKVSPPFGSLLFFVLQKE